jgi:hypothetical protein
LQEFAAGLGAERRGGFDVRRVLLVEAVIDSLPLGRLAQPTGTDACVGEERQQAIDVRHRLAETGSRERGRGLLIDFVGRPRRDNVNEPGHEGTIFP